MKWGEAKSFIKAWAKHLGVSESRLCQSLEYGLGMDEKISETEAGAINLAHLITDAHDDMVHYALSFDNDLCIIRINEGDRYGLSFITNLPEVREMEIVGVLHAELGPAQATG